MLSRQLLRAPWVVGIRALSTKPRVPMMLMLRMTTNASVAMASRVAWASIRSNSTKPEPPIKTPKPGKKQGDGPRIRYLFYMLVLSWVVLYFVTGKMDKKKPQTLFESEREFREYEERTGLKRRSKLVNHELNDHYRFYVIPYVTDDAVVDEVTKQIKQLDPAKQVKVIDPTALIAKEKEDETRRYCYLLQDLDEKHKSYPKGLITTLIKNEVREFMNTRLGTFDTNFVIKNYPQATDEAIKFENDVSDIQKCLVVHYDIVNHLPENPDLARRINNVVGYFNTVGRTKELVLKHNDRMDKELKEIMLEDL